MDFELPVKYVLAISITYLYEQIKLQGKSSFPRPPLIPEKYYVAVF